MLWKRLQPREMIMGSRVFRIRLCHRCFLSRTFTTPNTGKHKIHKSALKRCNLHINLRRPCDGTRLFRWVGGWVFVCIRSSIHSVRFGRLLRCAHKRIVNIMKVYIERKNMQVQLIHSIKNIHFIDFGNFEVRNFRKRHVYC